MSRWKIYYGDGTTYSNEDGLLEDAPGINVQVIAQADATVGRRLLDSDDFYWWSDDRWDCGDIFGLWDYLTRPGFKKVLFGRNLHDGDFWKILARARVDPDLPAKSASHPDETG